MNILSKIIIFLIAISTATTSCGFDQRITNTPLLTHAKEAFTHCEGVKGIKIIDSGHIICIHAEISPSIFVELMRHRREIKNNPFVVIASPGGRADSSIDIVRMLDPLHPVPVVGEMCVSACAQFLFLMGKDRVILHCGVVAMHGGPGNIANSLAMHLDDDDAHQNNIENIWLFHDFYKSKSISIDMVTKPPQDIQNDLNAGKFVFWQWSIHQLESFGINGITSDIDPDVRSPRDYDQVCKKYSIYRP